MYLESLLTLHSKYGETLIRRAVPLKPQVTFRLVKIGPIKAMLPQELTEGVEVMPHISPTHCGVPSLR